MGLAPPLTPRRAGVPGQAEDKFLATITADNQKVTFAHGLAWIDGKGKVSVSLLNAAPNAKEEARALAGGGSAFGVFDAPNVQLDLDFDRGVTRADLASFSSRHIGFREFTAGIFDWNAFKGGCGPVEFSGDLKPGGVVHGRLKGRAEPFPRPVTRPSTPGTWSSPPRCERSLERQETSHLRRPMAVWSSSSSPRAPIPTSPTGTASLRCSLRPPTMTAPWSARAAPVTSSTCLPRPGPTSKRKT